MWKYPCQCGVWEKHNVGPNDHMFTVWTQARLDEYSSGAADGRLSDDEVPSFVDQLVWTSRRDPVTMFATMCLHCPRLHIQVTNGSQVDRSDGRFVWTPTVGDPGFLVPGRAEVQAYAAGDVGPYLERAAAGGTAAAIAPSRERLLWDTGRGKSTGRFRFANELIRDWFQPHLAHADARLLAARSLELAELFHGGISPADGELTIRVGNADYRWALETAGGEQLAPEADEAVEIRDGDWTRYQARLASTVLPLGLNP